VGHRPLRVGAVATSGKDKHTLSAVRRPRKGCGHSTPSHSEPQLGQSPRNAVKTPTPEDGDVFEEYVAASRFFGQPQEFEDQSASLAAQALSSPNSADVLAREAAINYVHSL
jgi:hypothetical protein